MTENVQGYIDHYSAEVQKLYMQLRNLIYDSTPMDIEEKLWAKIPSYYVGGAFVRLIPFKKYINIEASAIVLYREELSDYKITPKGMLQIRTDQNIPTILKRIFIETLKQEF